jgi:hypothetical protein
MDQSNVLPLIGAILNTASRTSKTPPAFLRLENKTDGSMCKES